VQNFSTEDINKVANILGIDSKEITLVLKEIM
jgi:hypothetical protein